MHLWHGLAARAIVAPLEGLRGLASRVIRYERSRHYPLRVAEAWRLLADTNHLNRAIGLPSVEFSPLDGAQGKLVRDARARAYGLVPVRWKEYPFNWVRERRYSVRREFEWGPIAVIEGGIELKPSGDGVDVDVYADIQPANFSGRLFWRFATGVVTGTLDFCDHYLAGVRDRAPYAEPAPHRSHPNPKPLRERLRRLDDAAVAPAMRSRIAEFIRDAADDQVLRIRPFALAQRWGEDRIEVLRLFMYASAAGLFQPVWELMCPNCRVPKAESKSVALLPFRFHCDTCGISYATELDQRVELRFSIDPDVRPARDDVYCIGGPLRMPHLVSQQFLVAQENRPLDLALDTPVRLRAVGSSASLRLVPGAAARGPAEVSLIYAEGRWAGPHSLTGEQPDVLVVPAGCRLVLRNQTSGPLLAVVEDLRWTDEATSAAQVLAMPEFRKLFPAQTPASDRRFEVGEATLAFLRGVGADKAEDLRVAAGRLGALGGVPSGNGLLVAFFDLPDALQAAPALLDAGAGRIGIHRGPALLAADESGVRYFGDTVNAAVELASLGDAGEVVLSHDVYASLEGTAHARAVPSAFRAKHFTSERGTKLVRLSRAVAARVDNGEPPATKLAPR